MACFSAGCLNTRIRKYRRNLICSMALMFSSVGCRCWGQRERKRRAAATIRRLRQLTLNLKPGTQSRVCSVRGPWNDIVEMQHLRVYRHWTVGWMLWVLLAVRVAAHITQLPFNHFLLLKSPEHSLS